MVELSPRPREHRTLVRCALRRCRMRASYTPLSGKPASAEGSSSVVRTDAANRWRASSGTGKGLIVRIVSRTGSPDMRHNERIPEPRRAAPRALPPGFVASTDRGGRRITQGARSVGSVRQLGARCRSRGVSFVRVAARSLSSDASPPGVCWGSSLSCTSPWPPTSHWDGAAETQHPSTAEASRRIHSR